LVAAPVNSIMKVAFWQASATEFGMRTSRWPALLRLLGSTVVGRRPAYGRTVPPGETFRAGPDAQELLVPDTKSGMLNVAPWQALSEAFDIATLFEIGKTFCEFAGTGHDTEKTLLTSDTPFWLHPADRCASSAVTGPGPGTTRFTITGNEFGFLTVTTRPPRAPGKSGTSG
jgi:hypothetical protein